MESQYTRLKPKSWKDSMGPSTVDDKHFPSLTLSLDDLPEAAKWEIGQEYELGLKVKQTSMSKGKHGGSVSFDIVAVNPESDEDYDDDDGSDDSDDEDETEED